MPADLYPALPGLGSPTQFISRVIAPSFSAQRQLHRLCWTLRNSKEIRIDLDIEETVTEEEYIDEELGTFPF